MLKFKRNQKVLEILVEHGADSEILYVQKPHIGTDVLSQVMKNIREHIFCVCPMLYAAREGVYVVQVYHFGLDVCGICGL